MIFGMIYGMWAVVCYEECCMICALLCDVWTFIWYVGLFMLYRLLCGIVLYDMWATL